MVNEIYYRNNWMLAHSQSPKITFAIKSYLFTVSQLRQLGRVLEDFCTFIVCLTEFGQKQFNRFY